MCVNQCNCTALYKPSPPQLIIADISTKLNEEKKAFGSNHAAQNHLAKTVSKILSVKISSFISTILKIEIMTSLIQATIYRMV